MMGCLAAMALAGCGGSGSSSSGPSESLISEGFEGVAIEVGVATSSSQSPSAYFLGLDSLDQKFNLYLLKPGVSSDSTPLIYHEVTGTWSAKSLGNGKFEISLLGDASDKGCRISGRSFVLTIDNMEEYRTGVKTGATLDKAPFIHDKAGNCGYSLNTDQGGTAAIKQLDSSAQ